MELHPDGNQSVNSKGIFWIRLSLFLIVPDVLGAVGEPHPVMPVARTAAVAAAVAVEGVVVAAAVAVEVVVVAAVMVTHGPAAAASDPKGSLLGLVAPPEN